TRCILAPRSRERDAPATAGETPALQNAPGCLLLTADCLPPTADCLLPTAYCLLLTAYCLSIGARHVGMVVGVGRLLIGRRRILLESFHRHLDRLLELRIVALAYQLGIKLDLEVRGDAMVLHFPLAFGSVDGPARGGNETAVH